MPDRDPLELLASFGTGGPVDPLPAPEVRRLGDRRRTRRTAVSAVTGVVAVLAVVVPVGLYAARDGSGRPLPPSGSTSTASEAPTPDVTPPAGWRTTIPDDFPIAIGLDELDGPARQTGTGEAVGVADVELCRIPWWHKDDGAARVAAFALDAESSAVHRRTVALFPAGTDARAVLTKARKALEDCALDRTSNENYASSNEPRPAVLKGAGDESLVFTSRGGQVDGDQVLYDTGMAVFAMIRVGNAVAVVQDSGEGGGSASSIASSLTHVEAATRPLVSEMCIFAADPCGGPTESSTPTGTVDNSTTAIPSDFPINLGSPDLGEAASVNGTPAGERMTHADPCQGKGILTGQPIDRLDYDLMGPEFTEQRELRTFASPAEAQAALDNLATAAAGCPTEELKQGVTATWTVLDRTTGYHSVTVARTLGEEGGFTWQYTRVGLAVFGVVWLGEGGSPEQVRINADELTAITRQVAPEMCPFTKAGC